MTAMHPRRALCLLPAALLCGCNYLFPEGITLDQHRIAVQQGNAIDETQVRELRAGLTRKQVEFLLGSPTVADPFHPDRWDYPYFLEAAPEQGGSRLDRLSLEFEDDALVRVWRVIPVDRQAAALPHADLDAEVDWFLAADGSREAFVREEVALPGSAPEPEPDAAPDSAPAPAPEPEPDSEPEPAPEPSP